MKQFRKWAGRVGVLLLALIVILAGISVWVVRRAWTQVDGSIDVAGLTAPVEVTRDSWGVPHIYAQNEADLFFAQGYIHAQDRLWQLEMNRRVSQGTLSEIMGEQAINFDRYMRTLGLKRVAEQSWQEMDEETRSAFTAYANGVNAYISSHNGRLPVEFTISGVKPAPWTPVDSLAWGNALALNMGLNAFTELLQARVVAEQGVETLDQLFLFAVKDKAIVPAEVDNYQWLQQAQRDPDTLVTALLGSAYMSWASNNWVVDGSRTNTGKPILANDTHLDLEMPSMWYLNDLHGGRFNSVGFTIPGVPLTLIGHNQTIAWGFTNMVPDVQDLYVEQVDDLDNPKQYQFMGKWYDLEVITETITVKNSDPVLLPIYLTQHGPIINDIFDIPDEKPMSLQWTLYEGNAVSKAILMLNLAHNWDEFRTALQYWDLPNLNFVYADVDGNIGYQAAGRVPIRAADHQGILPVPGWTGLYEWSDFVPFSELPNQLNPADGFIATANNQIVSEDYPYMLTFDWPEPNYRVNQITDALGMQDNHSIADSEAIQLQTYSPPAAILQPYLLAAVEPADQFQADALAEVADWDFRFESDSIGATLYEIWYLHMLYYTFQDELGEDLMDEYAQNPNKHKPMMTALMADADNVWFDDISTPEKENRDDIARRAWTDALDWLRERYGRSLDGWTWGKVHTTALTHIPFGWSGNILLETLFNGPILPSSGGQFSVNVGWYDDPFDEVFATAQRMVLDLSDFDNSVAVNSTGQSGHLFYSHRADLTTMWQQGDYFSMFFTKNAVDPHAEAILTLNPR